MSTFCRQCGFLILSDDSAFCTISCKVNHEAAARNRAAHDFLSSVWRVHVEVNERYAQLASRGKAETDQPSFYEMFEAILASDKAPKEELSVVDSLCCETCDNGELRIQADSQDFGVRPPACSFCISFSNHTPKKAEASLKAPKTIIGSDKNEYVLLTDWETERERAECLERTLITIHSGSACPYSKRLAREALFPEDEAADDQ